MTIEFNKNRLLQGKRPKIIFQSAREAKDFLAEDPLACIYKSATHVTIITAYGSGKFTKQQWEKG